MFVLTGTGYAQVPKKINYQGFLEDSMGIPVDGEIRMTFAIYDTATGGDSLWSETRTVEVDNGRYSVILGEIEPIVLKKAKPYWLGITIETKPGSKELTSRVEITSVMYALFADKANRATRATRADTVTDFSTDDDENTFAGKEAGEANTDGFGNTFIGMDAGRANTTGFGNTFIGRGAGFTNTDKWCHTFVGYGAGYHNDEGVYNTFIGETAGYENTDGHWNTFVGVSAGRSNDTGEANTFIGMGAGSNNVIGSHNVFLGYTAGYHETESHRLYIESTYNSTPLIYGRFDTNVVRINGDLEYTGTLTDVSDRRLKENRGPFTSGLDVIAQLQPVRYHFKAENPLDLPSDRDYVGLIAQDVQAVIPEAVKEDEDGYLLLNNEPILWAMLNAIKELKVENDALKDQNDIMRKEIDLLKEHIGQ
jgi:hypothetical protein